MSQYEFYKACREGNLSEIDILLQDPRVDPSAQNSHAIGLASLYGYLDIVDKLLQDPRVDPAAEDNYAIRWASEFGHIDVVKRLLEHINSSK